MTTLNEALTEIAPYCEGEMHATEIADLAKEMFPRLQLRSLQACVAKCPAFERVRRGVYQRRRQTAKEIVSHLAPRLTEPTSREEIVDMVLAVRSDLDPTYVSKTITREFADCGLRRHRRGFYLHHSGTAHPHKPLTIRNALAEIAHEIREPTHRTTIAKMVCDRHPSMRPSSVANTISTDARVIGLVRVKSGTYQYSPRREAWEDSEAYAVRQSARSIVRDTIDKVCEEGRVEGAQQSEELIARLNEFEEMTIDRLLDMSEAIWAIAKHLGIAKPMRGDQHSAAE